MRTQIIELARDPTLIPHVYNYCDQWCRYCPVTARCLVYKAQQLKDAQRGGPHPANHNDIFDEALEFTQAIAEATGTTVAELDVCLSDPSAAPTAPAIGDPLERLGRTYAIQAAQFVMSSGLNVSEQPRGPDAAPLMIVAWFHMMIAAKIYRALVSSHRSANGTPELDDDARGSAKLVLVAIDRSRAALEDLAESACGPSGAQSRRALIDDDDARIVNLIGLLEMLQSSVEGRFPDARAFVRPGIDVPAPAPCRLP